MATETLTDQRPTKGGGECSTGGGAVADAAAEILRLQQTTTASDDGKISSHSAASKPPRGPKGRIVSIIAAATAVLGMIFTLSVITDLKTGHRPTTPKSKDDLTLASFPPIQEVLYDMVEQTPFAKTLYTDWENNYDGIPLLIWSRSHYWLGPAACLLYLGLVYWGPKYMDTRKAFNLKYPLMAWNLLLAVYSFFGATRVVPFIIGFVYKYGWHSSLCAPPVFTYGRAAPGFWTGLFIYSKYFELIDSLFIILRKRPLNFLHWYHHVTVLLYTWDAFVTEQPPGIFYCAMNYTVHAIMYFYYFLAGAMSRPPKWGMFVTILQISQMIAGVLITSVSLKNAFSYEFMYDATREAAIDPADAGTCYVSKLNMVSAAVMYCTYFYLFAAFFVNRYLYPKPRRATAAPRGQGVEKCAAAEQSCRKGVLPPSGKESSITEKFESRKDN